jgi:hypothetical protein
MSDLAKNTKKIADGIEETRQELVKKYGWNDKHERLPNVMKPEEIWLQPWCSDCEEDYLSGLGDRFWSEENCGDCEECGAKPTKYILSRKGT